jgi:hypothetical protein
VEALGEGEEVGRAERAAAEVVEGKARDAVGGLRNDQRAPEQRDLGRRAARRAGEAQESLVERRLGARVGGAMIDRRALELLQAEVGGSRRAPSARRRRAARRSA